MIARSSVSTLAIIIASAALVAAPGCNGASQDLEDTASIQAALETPNGGFDDSDEAPAFGDAAVLATPELVTTYADAVAPPADDPAAKPEAALYHVALVWGHLPPQKPVAGEPKPAAIDWSGAVSVDQGFIKIERTLAFDAKDSVAPRAEPNVVSFTSRTVPAVDGLLLRLAIPAGAVGTLHFATASLSTDIDLAALATDGGGVIPLGDGENGLAFAGFRDEPGLAKGFVMGRWSELAADAGHLRGRVFAADGAPLGHVKGIWGHAPKRDQDLFFGKYIDRDGQWSGLFGGSYGDGSFGGRWGTDEERGKLQGRYFSAEGARGFFVARWSETQ